MSSRCVRCVALLVASMFAAGASAQAPNAALRGTSPPSVPTENAASAVGGISPGTARDGGAVAAGPVTVVGRRVRRPSVTEVFERNLQPQELRFVSSDVGAGRRCTLALPFGYRSCTGARSSFVLRLG